MVADVGHEVGVVYVVDQWDVFVIDVLDVVLAEVVVQYCGVFERFGCDDRGVVGFF